MRNAYGMTRRRFVLGVLSVLAVLAAAGACVHDNDDPFDEGLDVDWPTSDPDRYHWNGLTDPFFEFWSWHVALGENAGAFSVTMGVANPGSDDAAKRTAFVQVSGSMLDAPVLREVGVDDFHASAQIRDVKVSGSNGTQSVVHGGAGGVTFQFNVTIDEGWEDTMGALTNIPAMPLNWHVNALRARATGSLDVDGETYEFESAPAVEDHFWGNVYPSVTMRVLAFDFDDRDASYVFFGGDLLVGPFQVPLVGAAFAAGGETLEMRTVDLNALASMEEDANGDWIIETTRGDLRLRARVLNLQDEGFPGLAFDEDGLGEGGRVWHDAVVTVETLERIDELSDWQVVDIATSPRALFSLGVPTPYQDF
ncbi:MAG: hypothetical protein M5R36_15840 [Deltaproteobacteria bacterium]|nr:hypothetical protein [Deltaproteobacteria bacterium]